MKFVGINKFEILLFFFGVDYWIGCWEIYGINVFKVCEVMWILIIIVVFDMFVFVEGMVSLWGVLVLVIDLVKYLGFFVEMLCEIMIVIEYNGYI